MKTFEKAVSDSTCQKRVTVCELYDAFGTLISRESNRCAPTGGVCCRLGVVQNKDNYDVHSNCNWTHAEIMALYAMPEEAMPYKAIVYGHEFMCDACEAALKKAGVVELSVQPKLYDFDWNRC